MRRAAKVDANQPAIVAALRKAGASVGLLHSVGGGCPDLVVGYRDPATGLRECVLVEVKDGSKPPSARKLTEDQEDWHAAWRGRPVAVVETVEDALRVIGVEGAS
jgi:hypothetical protein